MTDDEKRAKVRRDSVRSLVSTGVLMLILALAAIYAEEHPDQITQYYTPVASYISLILSKLFSYIPFTFFEAFLGIALIVMAVNVVIAFFEMLDFGNKGHLVLKRMVDILHFVMSIVFTFMIIYGFNIYAEPFSNRIDINMQDVSSEELLDSAKYYISRANELADTVEGYTGSAGDELDIESVALDVAAECESMRYVSFDRKFVTMPVKTLQLSDIVYGNGCEGLFFPGTGECAVSDKVFALAMPFEMAKLTGESMMFVRDAESDIAAYTELFDSKNELLKYSAYFMAARESLDALLDTDKAAFDEAYGTISGKYLDDMKAYDEYLEKTGFVEAESIENKISRINGTVALKYDTAELLAMLYLENTI